MSELLFRLFLAVLYFVNFTSRIRIIRNNHIEFADGKLKQRGQPEDILPSIDAVFDKKCLD